MVENSCCHGAEISKCAETKIFYTFFSGDENYGGNFGININRNFRLTWSSYLPRATRMSIMKKITENTWRKKKYFFIVFSVQTSHLSFRSKVLR